MLGLIIIATLAVGAILRILRNSSAAPVQGPPAQRSFFRSRGGWLLWAGICGGSFVLGGIFGQFWFGLALMFVGCVAGVSLELSSSRPGHKQTS